MLCKHKHGKIASMKKAPVNVLNRRIGRLKVMDVVVIVLTLILVGGGVWYRLQSASEEAKVCSEPGTLHRLTVSMDAFEPTELTLNRCDQVRIDNAGRQYYDFAFGSHDEHIRYPGFTMQALAPGEYFIFNALQSGDYIMHDHLRDKAKIRLSIREPLQ